MTRKKSTLAYREINKALFKLTIKQTLSSGELMAQARRTFSPCRGLWRDGPCCPPCCSLLMCLPKGTGAVP